MTTFEAWMISARSGSESIVLMIVVVDPQNSLGRKGGIDSFLTRVFCEVDERVDHTTSRQGGLNWKGRDLVPLGVA